MQCLSHIHSAKHQPTLLLQFPSQYSLTGALRASAIVVTARYGPLWHHAFPYVQSAWGRRQSVGTPKPSCWNVWQTLHITPVHCQHGLGKAMPDIAATAMAAHLGAG